MSGAEEGGSMTVGGGRGHVPTREGGRACMKEGEGVGAGAREGEKASVPQLGPKCGKD